MHIFFDNKLNNDFNSIQSLGKDIVAPLKIVNFNTF
jgi:hypothetical protein